jgi:hypothetical protein
VRGAEADIKAIGRRIHKTRFDALVQLLHFHGRISESCLLKSNRSPRSGCWLADPGGYFAGATNLSRAEYFRLLRSPVSLDVGDAEGGIVCRCNRRINIIADPMHFFHCPTSSQGQFNHRHRMPSWIRWRSRPSPPALRTAIDEEECIEKAGRIRQTTLSITDLRQRNIDDEAAGQRHGDLGVYVGGSRLIVDVAMADASAPSYRRPPPRLPPPPNEYHSCEPAPTRRSWEATPPPPRQQRWRPRPLLLSPPRSSSIVRN